MRLFWALCVGVGVMVLMMVASWLFRGDDDRSYPEDWLLPIVIGALMGLIDYFVPTFVGESAFLAPLSLAVCIGLIIYLMYWWCQDGSNFIEMLPLLGIVAIVYFVAKAAAVMTAALVQTDIPAKLIMVLPEIAVVGAVGFFIANLCYFFYKEVTNGSVFCKAAAVIVALLTAIIIAFLLFTKVFDGTFAGIGTANVTGTSGTTTSQTGTGQTGQTSQTGQLLINTASGAVLFPGTVGFYNLSIQNDHILNDFNFGPDPTTTGATVRDYDYDLRQRMAQDPALSAAVMAWADANLGTRYLGEFYESCKGDWAKTINFTKESFMVDTDLWYQSLVAFFQMLDQATLSLEEATGLKDQMYMNPYTVDGVPDVIVMTSDHDHGLFLCYNFVIKDNPIKVAYRIECGYQPTNVQQIMNIIPDDTPRVDPTPRPQPQPQPSPDPTPETDPTPGGGTPKKDPSKSPRTNTEPNDDSGPGPSTNNGVGATTSTADQSTNSNHGSLSDYNAAVSDLGSINATQKTGSDSSTPSTPAPTPSTTADNNGDSGNGGNPINTPTPQVAGETVSGDPESVGMLGTPD